MSKRNKDFVMYVSETIGLGNRLSESFDENIFSEYQERIFTLREMPQHQNKLNLLIERKFHSLELYNPQKYYHYTYKMLLHRILKNGKHSEPENLQQYIRRQNLLLEALKLYFSSEL